MSRFWGSARRVEEWIGVVGLLLMAALPIVQIVIRGVAAAGIPGYNSYIFHLVLFTAFLGGTIAAAGKQHLAIRAGIEHLSGERTAEGTPDGLPRGGVAGADGEAAGSASGRGSARGAGRAIQAATAFLAAAITIAFAWSAFSLALTAFEPGSMVGFIPMRVVVMIMPLGFLVMAVRFVLQAPAGLRIVPVLGLLVGTFLAYAPLANLVYFYALEIPLWIDSVYSAWFAVMEVIAVPAIILIIISAFFGLPLFVVLGGVALFLFARVGGSIEVIPNEGYVMLTGNTIPAIPLFTLAGFMLSESKSGQRLVRLFRAFFGWLPGGLVIASILVSTFFTTFTGASGVTILALGGLLLYILVRSGNHTERFATGVLTASGSIGLLFPPSLALIIYGVTAQVSIRDLFIAGLIPGAVMVLAMCAVGVIVSLRRGIESVPFRFSDAWAALKESIWEILLPVIIIVVYFLGIATLVETAAVAVAYTFMVEVVIHREIKLSDLRTVGVKALSIIGGVLIILALARGLSYFIIDAEVPTRLADWVEATISSKFVFLILVNLVLLVTGCFMDIFSAILVVAPLIIPLGGIFGVDPVHLGVIFIANMGIGFITPPVGLNLFLASYRFEVPLGKLYRNVLPFFAIQLAIVLVITYVPGLSLRLLGG